MNDTQLKIIIEAAQCGSFSKAETVCHMSKQAIAKQVDALEAELGFSIFNRSFQGISLTNKGAIFVKGAKKLLDLKQEIISECKEAADKENCLRVSSVEYHTLLNIVTDQFRQSYPQVKIVPVVHSNHSTLYRLSHNMIDLGAVSSNFKNQPELNIYYQKIVELPYMCVSRKGNALSKKEKIKLEDLENKKTLVFQNSIHPLLLKQLEKNCTKLEIKESFHQLLTDLYMAIKENYIVILANKFIYRLPDVDLIPLATKYKQEFGIVYQDKDNVNVQNYIALAKEIYK